MNDWDDWKYDRLANELGKLSDDNTESFKLSADPNEHADELDRLEAELLGVGVRAYRQRSIGLRVLDRVVAVFAGRR